MAKKNGWGGKRDNSGRNPKAKELEIIEKLDNSVDPELPFKTLNKLIKEENFNALKLYFEYRYGKPKDSIDITSGDEQIQNFNLSKLTEKELSVILKLHEGFDTDTNEE